MTDDQRREFWACLALKHTKGVGPRLWKKLLGHYGSAYTAVKDVKGWKAKGLASSAQIDAYRTEDWREKARCEWDETGRSGCGLLLLSDPLFPERLRQIPDPPICLYYAGDKGLLENPCVAMVGTRRSSAYGEQAAREIGEALSQAGLTIVSGLAYGIDRHAHLAGLSGIGSSIAVIGAGLNQAYPAGNQDVRTQLLQKGLILSEFSPDARAEPHNFPIRNRIISGLSLGVIVLEAPMRSGSLITSRQALEQGREVFAVPGPRGSKNHTGCFELINQGAKLVCSADDVLRELHALLSGYDQISSPDKTQDKSPVAPPEDLAPDARQLFALLQRSGQAMHIDSICRELGWDAGKTSGALLLLELRGLIIQQPGMQYVCHS